MSGRNIFMKSKDVWEENLKLFPDSRQQYPAENLVRLLSGKYIQVPKPPAAVMDHGFGHGNNLVSLSLKGYECAGCEISNHLIEEVSSLFGKHGKKVDLRQIKGLEIPFEDDQFDIVVSWDVIHYNGTRIAVLQVIKELHRILKPGGVLLLSTVHPDNSICDRMKAVGDGSFLIVDENSHDNREGLTFFVAKDEEEIKEMFSMFKQARTGRLFFDLFNPENRHAAYLIYGVK